MKLVSLACLLALCLSASTGLPHTATIYTDYTNSSTQLSLLLSPTEATYWDGTKAELLVVGAGYSCPDGTSAGAGLVIHIRLDNVEVATANLPWGCFRANRVTNHVSLAGLPPGAHTFTAQHTNSFEYHVQYIYTGTSTHREFFTTYTHTYLTRNHYWTAPCSASAIVTVNPSPTFHKLLVTRNNNNAIINYTGIPLSMYSLLMSPDLNNWYLLRTGTAGTNGQLQFSDNIYPEPRYYRVFGP